MTDISYSVHRLMNICSVNISDALVHIPGMKRCNHISHRGYGQDSWDNKIDRRTKDEIGREKLVGKCSDMSSYIDNKPQSIFNYNMARL